MHTDIFSLLDKYKLNSLDNLSTKVERLNSRDWTQFSNDLDEYYRNVPTPQIRSNEVTPLNFNFASLPSDFLAQISPYLLIADQVYIDDPLYDTTATLANWLGDKSAATQLTYIWSKKAIQAEAVKNIEFYLRAKEAIQEKKLVLYKQVVLPEIFSTFEKALSRHLLTDWGLQKKLYGNSNPLTANTIIIARALLGRLQKKSGVELAEFIGNSKVVREFANRNWVGYPILSSLSVFAVCGGLQGLSTDFLDKRYAYIFRRVLEIANRINKEVPDEHRLLLPAGFSNTPITLPTLQDVPIERVLDIINQEPSAFEGFKSTINGRLLQISAPVGSKEREQQIYEIGTSIRKDMNDIQLAYEEIQKSFSKKFAVHLLLGISSIVTAGLSTTTQNLNALSIAAGIFAGASLSTSVKEFAKDWLDYQQELLKLKSKENFFLWKLQSRKH